jgi:superfamily I DNA/RNA helicase
MTAYQSKGKEFDLVILADVTKRNFPGNDPEALRLFYVAMTRASKSWGAITPATDELPWSPRSNDLDTHRHEEFIREYRSCVGSLSLVLFGSVPYRWGLVGIDHGSYFGSRC